MARFKFFPRHRRPGLGELLGLSQAVHQVSRKHRLRIARDPMSPLNNVVRHTGPRDIYYSPPMQLARLLRRLFR